MTKGWITHNSHVGIIIAFCFFLRFEGSRVFLTKFEGPYQRL